ATVNDFAQTSFIDNCPLVLQQMIEGHIIQNPSITLVQLFQYATEMDRIYSFKPDTGPKTNSSAIASAPLISSLASPPSSQATPMEIDHIQIALNNINQRFNRLERNMGHNNNHNNNSNYNNGHPPRLTPDDREWCRRNNACFRCRKPGHAANNCFKYNNNTNNKNNNNNNNNNNKPPGRWVYQVTVGDSCESGKASDDQA
ncbi:hypothetical protein BGZ95_008633, partial [Linnemannia exigua]